MCATWSKRRFDVQEEELVRKKWTELSKPRSVKNVTFFFLLHKGTEKSTHCVSLNSRVSTNNMAHMYEEFNPLLEEGHAGLNLLPLLRNDLDQRETTGSASSTILGIDKAVNNSSGPRKRVKRARVIGIPSTKIATVVDTPVLAAHTTISWMQPNITGGILRHESATEATVMARIVTPIAPSSDSDSHPQSARDITTSFLKPTDVVVTKSNNSGNMIATATAASVVALVTPATPVVKTLVKRTQKTASTRRNNHSTIERTNMSAETTSEQAMNGSINRTRIPRPPTSRKRKVTRKSTKNCCQCCNCKIAALTERSVTTVAKPKPDNQSSADPVRDVLNDMLSAVSGVTGVTGVGSRGASEAITGRVTEHLSHCSDNPDSLQQSEQSALNTHIGHTMINEPNMIAINMEVDDDATILDPAVVKHVPPPPPPPPPAPETVDWARPYELISPVTSNKIQVQSSRIVIENLETTRITFTRQDLTPAQPPLFDCPLLPYFANKQCDCSRCVEYDVVRKRKEQRRKQQLAEAVAKGLPCPPAMLYCKGCNYISSKLTMSVAMSTIQPTASSADCTGSVNSANLNNSASDGSFAKEARFICEQCHNLVNSSPIDPQ